MKGKFKVIVRGLDGIEDAQVFSGHRTLNSAMKKIAASKWSSKRNIAGRYNARWSIERNGKQVCGNGDCGL